MNLGAGLTPASALEVVWIVLACFQILFYASGLVDEHPWTFFYLLLGIAGLGKLILLISTPGSGSPSQKQTTTNQASGASQPPSASTQKEQNPRCTTPPPRRKRLRGVTTGKIVNGRWEAVVTPSGERDEVEAATPEKSEGSDRSTKTVSVPEGVAAEHEEETGKGD